MSEVHPAAEVHALLNEDGRELENIEFLPGENPTPEEMCAEAVRVMRSVKTKNTPDTPPVTGVPQTKL